MDPLLSALFGSLATAVFGGLAALIGAAIQSKREHAKWLRERRYEAYTAALIHLEKYQQLMSDRRPLQQELAALEAMEPSDEVRDRIAALRAEVEPHVEASLALGSQFSDALIPFRLLGPDAVEGAAFKIAQQLEDTPAARSETVKAFITAARKALKVKP